LPLGIGAGYSGAQRDEPGLAASAHVHDAAIAPAHGNLKLAIAAPGAVDEISAAAVDPPDIPESVVADTPRSLSTADRPPAAEIRSNRDVDSDGISGSRHRHGRDQQGQNKHNQCGSRHLTLQL
jgi:hypothetical protein